LYRVFLRKNPGAKNHETYASQRKDAEQRQPSMNNANPFIPQGSLLEQKNKKRARVKRTILAIFAFNILLVSPLLLIQACGHGDKADNTATNSVAPDTSMATTNVETAMPATSTNPVVSTPPPATPLPTAPATPAPAANPSEYVIVKGDNFASIGKKFGVSVKALEAANPTVVPTRMKVGDKIQIPAATAGAAGGATTMSMATDTGEKIYVVKSGDNLTKIASAHGTTVKTLRALNNLSTDAIKVGDKLKLPVKASTTTAAPDSTTMPTAPATVMSNPPALSAPGR
jgi:LysM repeat protein